AVSRPVGRGQKEISLGDGGGAVAAPARAPVGVEEGDRLPDGEYEPKAQLLLQLCRLAAEPDAELGAVDDVRSGQRLLEAAVAVTHGKCDEVPEPPARERVADRADAGLRQGDAVDVVQVRSRHADGDVVAVGEQLPGTELPWVRQMTSEDDDPRAAHVRNRPPGFRCRSASRISDGTALAATATTAKATTE